MADEEERFMSAGEGSPLTSGSLARIDLHPSAYHTMFPAGEDLRRDAREHLLARITPRELVFIEHVCGHPEQSDEEVMTALGLRESTVLAYYAHLGRNFKVHNSVDLRRWAFKEGLLPTPDADTGGEEERKAFDPWVRWY